jgi:hypothetical protein
MSYLAPPPLNPIVIDAGVDYNYVIAQQGYGKVTKPTNPGFAIKVYQGEPALAIIRFTNTPGANPTYHTLNFQVGTQLHSVAVTILPVAASQRVPNITSAASLAAPKGSPVSVALASDIAATSYSVEGTLPSGLTYDAATNLLTGSVAADGFYPLTFAVYNGSYLYKRYFVLVVGTGTTSTSGLTPFTISGSDARILYDGDFTQAQIAGIAKYEIAFRDDPKIYLYSIPYWQFINYYEEPALGSAGPLGGFYVGGAQASFKSIGGGVIEFEREFALLPGSRSEWETFVYPFQLVQWKYETSGDPPVTTFSASINEVPTTMHSRVQYDYFQTDDPQNGIPLPRGPRAMIDSGVYATWLYFMHGYWNMNAVGGSTPGAEVLAEDATFRKWKGNIYQRTMRFITSESFGQVVS